MAATPETPVSPRAALPIKVERLVAASAEATLAAPPTTAEHHPVAEREAKAEWATAERRAKAGHRARAEQGARWAAAARGMAERAVCPNLRSARTAARSSTFRSGRRVNKSTSRSTWTLTTAWT